MNKKTKVVLTTLASVLIIAVAGNTSAFAYSLPGITPSGKPAFTNIIRAHLNPQGRLRVFGNGKKPFWFQTGEASIVGTGAQYRLNAQIDEFGNLLSGDVSIRGNMEGDLSTSPILLFSADLTAANLVDDSNLWGFNTTNIFCADVVQSLVEGTCTNSESVYVLLGNAFSGDFGRNFTSNGIAVTTVPVPAAIWLFGSGLGLLGWVRRRAMTAA